MHRYVILIAAAFLSATVPVGPTLAQDSGAPIATLRGMVALDAVEAAPRNPVVEETDRRRARNYPEQPPTIPHKIDGYQVDRNVNQCLSCHARNRVEESNAPMVSITHFMDRDGQFLATVSPRRYFCDQCHVTQARVPEPMANTFVDIDSLLAVEAAQEKN